MIRNTKHRIPVILMAGLLLLTTSGCGAKKEADPNRRTVVENGDRIDLDFTGYIDGKTFDGGGTGGFGTELEIGSGEFIPGFEEGCIGHEIGETFEITVTFPDDYKNENLAGKEALFEIKINDILAFSK